MATYKITSNVSVNVNDKLAATFDTNADFEEIALRITNLRNRAVNVRVSDLGDWITFEMVEFGAYGRKVVEKIENIEEAGAVIDTYIKNFLG